MHLSTSALHFKLRQARIPGTLCLMTRHDILMDLQ